MPNDALKAHFSALDADTPTSALLFLGLFSLGYYCLFWLHGMLRRCAAELEAPRLRPEGLLAFIILCSMLSMPMFGTTDRWLFMHRYIYGCLVFSLAGLSFLTYRAAADLADVFARHGLTLRFRPVPLLLFQGLYVHHVVRRAWLEAQGAPLPRFGQRADTVGLLTRLRAVWGFWWLFLGAYCLTIVLGGYFYPRGFSMSIRLVFIHAPFNALVQMPFLALFTVGRRFPLRWLVIFLALTMATAACDLIAMVQRGMSVPALWDALARAFGQG